MTDESDDVPAGWYPSPHGGQRYWDGHRWLALPDPDQPAAGPTIPYPTDAPVKRSKTRIIAIAAGLAVLAAAGVGGLLWKSQHDTQMRNEAAAASSSAAAAAAQQQAALERVKRGLEVKEIEDSVMKLAKKHASEGVIDGPVLSVSCNPVNGGSTDDLTEKTTVFECFVAEKNNGDGTKSGIRYHATQNWTTGEYTYGFGAPH